MNYDELREKFPEAGAVIDLIENLMKDREAADIANASALKALYDSDVDKAMGILEKRAGKVITDAFIR